MDSSSQLYLNLGTDSGKTVSVRGIALDSRQVQKGFLFAALPGSNLHGATFIAQAIKRGALAVLTDSQGVRIAQEQSNISPDQLIRTEKPRQELARLAAQYYQKIPKTCVAVTGTNGKTSVATMCRQIWEALDIDAVSIGTTGIEGGYSAALKHTTPDAIALHDHLSKIQKLGIEHVSIEASSHGLSQSRLDGIEFDAAGFTNLTRDHLDYHPTVEDYLTAKLILFRERLKKKGAAVICLDGKWGEKIAQVCQSERKQTILIGGKQSQIQIMGQRLLKNGQEVTFRWGNTIYEKHLSLIGAFQLKNALVASGLTIGSGCKAEEVFSVLEQLKPARGRMELIIEMTNGRTVFVDYAHTPDALKSSLESLRKHVLNKIRVLFGAGGDRDQGKRKLMGAVAQKYADYIYVTDDNPRNENPATIRSEIMLGCPEANEIGDRSLAIYQAINDLQGGEALLIAGKGHEAEQIIGSTAIPFDDAEQASIAARIVEGKNPG